MAEKELNIPFYAKATILLIGITALFALLYIAKSIVLPLIFAIIIAILLSPIVNFFVRIKINRVLAILITIILAYSLIAVFGILLFSQVSRFSESWPILVEKFTGMLNNTITWASDNFEINPQKLHEWIAKTKGSLINTNSAAIGQTLVSVGKGLVVLFIIPIYIFMILFYQPLLLDFIRKIFGETHRTNVSEVVTQTRRVIQRYLKGLILEFVIVAALYSITLLILGIDYAVLLGLIGALLNIIPYIGALIAATLSVMIALATKPTALYAFYVFISYLFIHIVDYNFIIPKIVASRVKINALFSIIAIIVGHALWGIPGMFLSIPLLAIIKLIFDHIDPLKPWGFLLGDTMPPIISIEPIFKIIKKKS